MANQTITVWSGFVHQGMVALVVALAKIEELEKQGKSLDVHSLQLEGVEDFSFLENSDRIEVHQVKAWAGKSEKKNYEKALSKLEKYPVPVKKFLHSAEEISDWGTYSGPVERYTYPDGSSSFGQKLADMQHHVLASEFWKKLGVDSKAAYFALNQSLAECVCNAHLKTGANGKFEAVIPLKTLKDWTIRFQTALACLLGDIWQAMWTGLHKFLDDGENPVDHEQEVQLMQFVRNLSILDQEAMRTFLININPHEEVNRRAPLAFQLFNNYCWKDVFLKILRDVKKLECQISGHHVPFFRHDKDWWVPTMIMSDNKKDVTEAIRNNIASSFVVYFDATILITQRIEESPKEFQDSILEFVLEDGVKKELEKVGEVGIPLLGGKLQRIVTIETAIKDLNA